MISHCKQICSGGMVGAGVIGVKVGKFVGGVVGAGVGNFVGSRVGIFDGAQQYI